MQATRLEVLLAIATSEFEKTTHVHFMPVGKSFVGMLKKLRITGHIEPLAGKYYIVTKKGWHYIRKQQKEHFKQQDDAINKFVDGLK